MIRWEERQAERQARQEERLNQAVEDGKITEDQKNALLAKKEEWRAEREGWGDLSHEEQHEKMQEHREEMRQWMEDNGFERGDFGGRGFGKRFHR